MDTNEIKKYLKKYAGLKMSVENQLERIARAKNNTEIPAMRTSDGSQHQPGGSDRLGNSVIKWMDTKERLLPMIEANVAQMRLIEAQIDSLEDPFESEVLRLRYLDGRFEEDGEERRCQQVPWKYVALTLYGGDDESHKQAVFRLHGKALQSFGEVLKKYETDNMVLR